MTNPLKNLFEKLRDAADEIVEAAKDRLDEETMAFAERMEEAEGFLAEIIDDMPDEEAEADDWRDWGYDLQERVKAWMQPAEEPSDGNG